MDQVENSHIPPSKGVSAPLFVLDVFILGFEQIHKVIIKFLKIKISIRPSPFTEPAYGEAGL